jgi:hypothetical protein
MSALNEGLDNVKGTDSPIRGTAACLVKIVLHQRILHYDRMW